MEKLLHKFEDIIYQKAYIEDDCIYNLSSVSWKCIEESKGIAIEFGKYIILNNIVITEDEKWCNRFEDNSTRIHYTQEEIFNKFLETYDKN